MNGVRDKAEPALLPVNLSDDDRSKLQLCLSAINRCRVEGNRACLVVEAAQEPGLTALLPRACLEPLGRFVQAVLAGQELRLMPRKREFTSAEAAEFLGVERVEIVRMMSTGRLAYTQKGRRLRIPYESLAQIDATAAET